MPEPIVFAIDPLPDFLADHTLAATSPPQKLDEISRRWVQFIGGLWTWCNRAAFALRFVSGGGATHVFFIAIPQGDADGPGLRSEVEVLLRTHRLVRANASSPLPLAVLRHASRLERPAFAELGQYCPTNLWTPGPQVSQNRDHQARFPFLHSGDWSAPPVIYPWRGPGGPFLLPMESLVSQPVRCMITIHLMPTVLATHEREWLAMMAAAAQSMGEDSIQALGRGAAAKRVDPAAALAGKLYLSTLRRLSSSPFLVLVQCAADGDRSDVARAVAGTIQALVNEEPFDRPDPEFADLPSGAAPYFDESERAARCTALHDRLAPWEVLRRHPLGRLPLLVDASGAATVFRLPVSVRGGVPGIEVRQLAPDFVPGPRRDHAPPRHLLLGRLEGGGLEFMAVDDLTRHALITGFTGTGKTVTVLQLLHQLWIEHRIPFLVLESAKQEYRGLVGVSAFAAATPALWVHTLGNETCAPLRMNPFELLPGVRVEAHLSRLQACFEAAVPPIGPSTSVIAEAMHLAYEEAGWGLTDALPADGRARRFFPTLRDFVRQVERVIEARGYRGETLDNLQAALVGRFRPLLLGSKGLLFDVQRCDPSPAALLEGPAILEMNDLNVDDKALVTMFVLTVLREHREAQRSAGGRLRHVTVVEEAHNVLAEVESVGSGENATKGDARFKAVEAFCMLLAEIRAMGEGIIIADQSPQKLARDAVRNTNLQIAHQLRDTSDREAVAGAMIMDDEQRDFLGKLPPGSAALFRTGLEKATFVKVPRYAGEPRDPGHGFRVDCPDAVVREHMLKAGYLDPTKVPLILPFQGCAMCGSPCAHRDVMHPACATSDARARSDEMFRFASEAERSAANVSHGELVHDIVQRGVDAARSAGSVADLDAVWCHFVHSWSGAGQRSGRPAEDWALDADHRRMLAEMWNRLSGV